MTTVADKKSNYSVADYSHDKCAIALQDNIGIPNMAEFIKIVENNMLINLPVSKDDIKIAKDIWGPDRVKDSNEEQEL